jgi:hypothetical protein
MMSDMPAELRSFLEVNVLQPPAPKHAQFVRPREETERERVVRTGKSNAWKPSYPGEEPPW